MRLTLHLLAEVQESLHKDLSQQDQKKALIYRIEKSGWEVDRLIEGIHNTTHLYFETVSQMKASKWSEGSVSIVGDAAYRTTPIAGRGY